MLSDVITLAVAIGIIYGLHQLIEAIRNRNNRREPSLLERLGFNPDQHELIVRLAHGGTITGTPDPQGIGSLKDGIILTNARTNGNEGTPSALTYIPGHSITAVGTATKETPPKQ